MFSMDRKTMILVALRESLVLNRDAAKGQVVGFPIDPVQNGSPLKNILVSPDVAVVAACEPDGTIEIRDPLSRSLRTNSGAVHRILIRFGSGTRPT